MKKLLALLALLAAFATASVAQTTYDITFGSGVNVKITGALGGRNPHLTVISAPILGVYINGVLDSNFTTGTVAFSTGNLKTGNQIIGDTFQTGGTFTVQTADLGVIFTGTWADNAAWLPVFNANMTHQYVLHGQLTDASGDTGSMYLITKTATSVTCFFNGSEAVSGGSVHIVTAH